MSMRAIFSKILSFVFSLGRKLGFNEETLS